MAKLQSPKEAAHAQPAIDAVTKDLATPVAGLIIAPPGQTLTAADKAFNFCLVWAKVGPAIEAITKFLSVFSWFTGAWVSALLSLEAVADASCTPAPPLPPAS